MIPTAIIAPLIAAFAILALRRAPAPLALVGSGIGAFAALFGLSGGDSRVELPGLPGYPLVIVHDPLSALLSGVVGVVGFIVMVYAVGYMVRDGGKVRFYAGMSFFVAAMQTLVLSGDWILLLASWEVIGAASYLLISHDSNREDAAPAAARAFLYTRTADLGLYVAVFVLVSQTGTTNISETLQSGGVEATLAGVMLLVAAAGKSAQVPFSSWLRGAMAGPTPVSALLHSATLVAAGAILVIRTSPLLPETILLAIGLLGGITVAVAGLTAASEGDLKRMLAASTSSQYGFMLLAVGAGSPVAAAFHLVAHAAMKGSLFLAAGIFQHSRGSTRFDDLGGVGRGNRLVFLGFVVSGLALVGIPPLSGFFSKDAILAAALDSRFAFVFAPLALVGTFLTGVYVARAIRLLWRGSARDEFFVPGLRWMGAALAVIVAISAVVGFASGGISTLLGADLPKGLAAVALGLVFSVAGLALGWLSPIRVPESLRRFAESGFRVGGGVDGLVVRPALALSLAASRFDRALHSGVTLVGRAAVSVAGATVRADERGIDGFIAALVGGTVRLGGRARRLQSGLVHRELALAAVGGAIVLVAATAAGFGVFG